MKKSFIALNACFVLVLGLFTGCATTIGFNVTRPSLVDMNGAEKVAVLPFQPAGRSDRRPYIVGHRVTLADYFLRFDNINEDEKEVINYINSRLQEKIAESKYLVLINSDKVKSSLSNGSITNPADAYITGQFTSFNVTDKKKEEVKKVKVKGEEDTYTYINEVYYIRYVNYEYIYQIIDSKTEEVLAIHSISKSTESYRHDKPYDLPSALSIIKSDLNKDIAVIMKEIQPYEEYVTVTLLDNKDQKEKMKQAKQLAKQGLYQLSYDEFMNIYLSTETFEAGYNAALLLETMGDLYGAKNLMQEVYNRYPSSKASTALSKIENEITKAELLRSQLDARNK